MLGFILPSLTRTARSDSNSSVTVTLLGAACVPSRTSRRTAVAGVAGVHRASEPAALLLLALAGLRIGDAHDVSVCAELHVLEDARILRCTVCGLIVSPSSTREAPPSSLPCRRAGAPCHLGLEFLEA